MIVYCSRDLIFATKIASTAEALGLAARPARDEAALEKRLNQVDDGRLNEPVTGVLIDLELGQAALSMVDQVKQYAADLPVVCFGSHVAAEALRQARERGADQVLPRSAFSMHLPTILGQLADR
jgi:CheY-like chemotaxis protein